MARPNFNNKPNNKPTKMQVTTYEKKFDSFTIMQKELKELHPEFNVIFPYDDEEVTPVNMTDDVLKYFIINSPDIYHKKNIASSVSVSSNKVSLKTNKFFSLKWQFKYDKEGNISDLFVRISVFSRDNKLSMDLKDMLEIIGRDENGWSLVEYDK